MSTLYPPLSFLQPIDSSLWVWYFLSINSMLQHPEMERPLGRMECMEDPEHSIIHP